MKTNTSFIKFSKLVLATVFLVIAAGAVVRMTQSGMGCPDWPTCFGRWVPPTNASQLPPDFEKYLKQQDIDHTFNVFHTWTEYVNRLLGALLGLFLFIQFIWSLKFWKKNRKIIWLCLCTLLLTGFQAWLGKKVVDTNLATLKITTHMLVALLIAALSFTVIHWLQPTKKLHNKAISITTLIVLLLLVVQIILGTQVRQQIDVISKAMDYNNRAYWIEKLDYVFYIHRSFSLVVAALCVYLVVQFNRRNTAPTSTRLVLFCIIGEMVLGVIMSYLNIPALAQPLHLLLSAILFIALYNNWLATSVKAA